MALLAALIGLTGAFIIQRDPMVFLKWLGLYFLVINIAFVQNKIIDVTEFYILMFTAFLLNITVPISLKWWKPYYLGEKTLFGRPLTAIARSVDPPDKTTNEEIEDFISLNKSN